MTIRELLECLLPFEYNYGNYKVLVLYSVDENRDPDIILEDDEETIYI